MKYTYITNITNILVKLKKNTSD